MLLDVSGLVHSLTGDTDSSADLVTGVTGVFDAGKITGVEVVPGLGIMPLLCRTRFVRSPRLAELSFRLGSPSESY